MAMKLFFKSALHIIILLSYNYPPNIYCIASINNEIGAEMDNITAPIVTHNKTISHQCVWPKIRPSINSMSPSNNNEDIYIGFLAGYKRSKNYLGALPLAIEAVNNDSDLLPGKTLKFISFDIGSVEINEWSAYPIRLMTQMRDNNVMAIIGPDETCKSEALVAAAWDLPIISYKCTDTDVSNKTIFHSFARTLPPASKISKSVISLLMEFKWHKFVIVVNSRPWSQQLAHAIKLQAEKINLTATASKTFTDYIPYKISKMQDIVDTTYKINRIYVFIGEHLELIGFIRCLQNRGLLEYGEYMVVSVDDGIYDPIKQVNIVETAYIEKYLNYDTANMQPDVFKSVLRLGRTSPINPEMNNICDRINEFSAESPFFLPVHRQVEITVPVHAAYLYDAIIIYARAATEVLKRGGDIRNGTAIMSHIFNQTYHSIEGFDVFIDGNGDAEGNYTVFALQDEIDETTNYLMWQMKPVGNFTYEKDYELPIFNFIANERINWMSSGAPLAEPICGFFDELCRKESLDWRYALIGSSIAFLLLIAGAFLFKHYRYEQKLACLLWKVDMKDVTLLTNDISDSETRTKSLIQTCRHSLMTEGDTSKRAYTNIGLYRGNIVAVKPIYKRSVDLTRAIRKELKQMREVHHENIITFIGASVDQNYVAVLTSYCARGSLADVLANEDLSLDQMFISSLVSDILKGLIYLHDSDIISHGNLTSSNCLVDSRWVCQITDFGLHEFKSGQEEPNKEQVIKRNLWKAPELLRAVQSTGRGTQKGDVYSFGIVLYEIIGRNGPWGDNSFSHKKIIENVQYPTSKMMYYRPPLKNLNIPDYVKDCLRLCWEEEPEDRPDIRLIRIKLKEMQSGLKPNIFDNMLAIMEKYAYNLEGLVHERTNQLYEEKKKTENLLLRMLPRTVAESLKRGERVEAENFDCVTIFFSDLVGFTELCCRSTPLQVVEMLNDLYTCCDSIISNYGVYKVETIGDAYMVVSGLPIRNGNYHASEIAAMALHILNKVSKLEIKHCSGELVQIRIGIHSGQCVAGVVGLKMPRYCLFGDTVNTASRMESSGQPLKIHISDATYNLLAKIGGFNCVERGLINIKGKGEMRTYWLLSEDDARVQKRFGSIDMNDAASSFNDVAPDLICNNYTDTDSISSSQKIRKNSRAISTIKLRQRARSSFSNISSYDQHSIIQNAWMDECTTLSASHLRNTMTNKMHQRQQLPLRSETLNNKSFCDLCQRKQVRFSSSGKIKPTLNSSFESIVSQNDILLSSSKTLQPTPTQPDTICRCKLQSFLYTNENLKCNIAYPYRLPRSAPHITFM